MSDAPPDTPPPPPPGGSGGGWKRFERLGRAATWLIVIAALVWVWQWSLASGGSQELGYSEFKQAIADGRVSDLAVEPESIEGTITDESGNESRFRTVRVEDDKLVEELTAAGVEFHGEAPSMLQPILAWTFPILLLVGFWMFMSRRMVAAAGAPMAFGKSKARLTPSTDIEVTFDDVAGCDEAKLELEEVVSFLKDPERYEKLGAKIPKGVLLVGPPGTGKTLLARAVAGQAGVPFFSISGSDFVEMFVGVGAARVRDLFEQAKKTAPCIVFIDELDAIGRHRGAQVIPTNDEREQTLDALLVQLDGFEPNAGVILLAATNRPDVLDAALLRPGRFDRQVVLDAPDVVGREAILAIHARGKPLADDVDLSVVARATPGFSGADLANALNEAALLAARRGNTEIAEKDIEAAVEKVVAGPERRSRKLRPEDRERIAYHEVGHAVVAHFSPRADPVHKISIVPRGHAALGYTLQLPDQDMVLRSSEELLDQIRGLLGGRAAEFLRFGSYSTGAENDIERATSLARQMVALYGMSEAVGPMRAAHRQSNPFMPQPEFGADCSEVTAHTVDEEVRRIITGCEADATRILREHREQIDQVAAQLLESETLDREQFGTLLGPRPLPKPASRAPVAKLVPSVLALLLAGAAASPAHAAPPPTDDGPRLEAKPAVTFHILDPETRLVAPHPMPDGSSPPMQAMPYFLGLLGAGRWGELGFAALTRSAAADCETAGAGCVPESTAAILFDFGMRRRPVTIFFGPMISTLGLTRPASAASSGRQTSVTGGFLFGIRF